jgi:CDP-diacylglycerol--glycerol-3-phosphate 3-phosphatidyltransferase
MSLVDAFDGPLARLRGEPRDFGAFVDSVSDRYAELLTYAGLLWYSLQHQDTWLSLAVYFAAFGSVLVSYTRARAQSLGYEAKVGIFSRVERIFILGLALFFNYVFIGVTLIAVGSNLTALRRVWHVRYEAHKHESYHRKSKKE